MSLETSKISSGKVSAVLNTTPSRLRRSGTIAPRILNLSTRWRWWSLSAWCCLSARQRALLCARV